MVDETGEQQGQLHALRDVKGDVNVLLRHLPVLFP
jgi:hypothetical protein